MRPVRTWATMAAIGIALAGGAAAQDGTRQPTLVFFDWGKPELRGDDAATLDQVAVAWRAEPAARLRLVGHTDRSGSALFNRSAGLRRADRIRTELEKRGIPKSAMSIVSMGEEQPLVPTEDGVREVQNRRVEIRIER